MLKREYHDLEISETKKKQIAYTKEFKTLVSENPGVIRFFLDVADHLEEDVEKDSWFIDKTESNENISVTLVSKFPDVSMFKLILGGQSFFIKKSREPSLSDSPERHPKGHDAYNEIMTSAKVRAKVKDLPWVGIVDYKFGFRDKNGFNYFVSRWEGLPSVALYLHQLDYPLEHTLERDPKEILREKKQIQNKFEKLKILLKDLYNVSDYNMFYDKKNEKIILFDLHEIKKLPHE